MAGFGQARRARFIGVLGTLALLTAPAAALRAVPAHAATCTWMDTTKSPDQRANELLVAMTIDDKIAMVHQPDPIFTHFGTAGHIPPNPALCIPDLVLNDAGQGVGDAIPANTVTAFTGTDRAGRELGSRAADATGSDPRRPGLAQGRQRPARPQRQHRAGSAQWAQL